MPIVDRREFGGRFTVRETSRRLRCYRYAEIQIMEMLGGWCHTTPSLVVRAAFGSHLWDDAQHADQVGTRIAQLRGSSDRQEPPNDEFARLCEKIWRAPSTLERLIGVYKVLKPHLVSAYSYHTATTDPLTDEPTCQLLTQLAAAEQAHVLWGQAVIESFTSTVEDKSRAIAWQGELEQALLECGGVSGSGVEAHWLPYAGPSDKFVADKVIDAERRQQASGTPPKEKKPDKGTYTFAKTSEPVDYPIVEDPFWYSEDEEVFRSTAPVCELGSREFFAYRLHTLIYGEIDTVDRLGKMLAEFPDLPWSMRMDIAHQIWDEARHIQIVAKAAQDQGASFGQYPWTGIIWRLTQYEDDPLRRIAVNNCWGESLLCGTLNVWIKLALEAEDHKLAELLDFVLADELVHVEWATRWIRELTEEDPQRRQEMAKWARKTAFEIQQFRYRTNRVAAQDDPVKIRALTAIPPYETPDDVPLTFA